MTELEYIRHYQSKLDKQLRRQLHKVKRTGEIGKDASESMAIAGWIEFGGPIEGISRYNCWRLTKKGKQKLEDLAAPK